MDKPLERLAQSGSLPRGGPPPRRIARRVFTLWVAVSLVLCAATAALWVRSEFRNDTVYHLRPSKTAAGEPSWDSWRVQSGDGTLALDRMRPAGLWFRADRTDEANRGQWGWRWHQVPDSDAPSKGSFW